MSGADAAPGLAAQAFLAALDDPMDRFRGQPEIYRAMRASELGVGPWSAKRFLLRSLGRPDVFPAGDLGLRRGIELLDALASLPTIPGAAQRALAWRPYRSSAAKYLWLLHTAPSPVSGDAQARGARNICAERRVQ